MTALWDDGLMPLQWGVALGAALIAMVCDLTSFRIPNRLTGPVLFSGLLWAGAYHGLAGLADSASACVLLATPYVVLFVFAGGGAGDAKLMGAIGSWLGVVNGVAVLAAVSLAAVVLALAIATSRGKLKDLLFNLNWIVLGALLAATGKARSGSVPAGPARQQMPYAAAIFAGVCLGAVGVWLWRAL